MVGHSRTSKSFWSISGAVDCLPRPNDRSESRADVEATCEVSILDFRARVDGPGDLVQELRGLYPRTVAVPGSYGSEASTRFRIRIDASGAGCHLERDGATFWATDRRSDLVPTLEWAVNTAAVDRLGDRYLLLHAGSVARNGRGMLLPAASGSGKSTLVAGLAAAGFQYFGDDVAAIQTSSLRLVPFAKSICVKSGSRAALSSFYPQVEADVSRRRWGGEPVWYLAPPARAWPVRSVPVHLIVLPRYVPGSLTRLEPITRTTALTRLLEQSFSARRHGAAGIETTVELLGGATCYALTVGDLHRAVALLADLTASPDPACDADRPARNL
jgi:hypothetical protein